MKGLETERDNRLKIKNHTKIYVSSPANVVTGGPELLHQLVYELNKLGLNAFMFYFDKTKANPVPEAYKKYKNPYVENIDDIENNILITPEVFTDKIYEYNHVQKVIWWLSIDNYYERFYNAILWKRVLKLFLYHVGYYRVYRFKQNERVFHFVQSEYAKQYLMKKRLKNIFFLGDYLNELFILNQLKSIEQDKKNIVIYNPKKGSVFTKKIIEKAPHIKFVPLENMSRDEVSKLLLSAKVYIDFGNHPGKDRIPREAAISGCCVITSKRGSAKYYEDVAIDENFKFEDTKDNISNIIDKIEDCFINYDSNYQRFKQYREKIKNEQNNFINDIRKIFIVQNN